MVVTGGLWQETFAYHVGQADLVCLCLDWRQKDTDFIFLWIVVIYTSNSPCLFYKLFWWNLDGQVFSYLIYEWTLE